MKLNLISPPQKVIDLPLIWGAVIFGVGWGIMGVCPGPGLVNIVTLDSNALTFIVSSVVGIFLYKGSVLKKD